MAEAYPSSAHGWRPSGSIRSSGPVSGTVGMASALPSLAPEASASASVCWAWPTSHRRVTARKSIVGQTLADDVVSQSQESLTIAHLPVVETEGFFIQVAEQVERLNADVGAPDCALQEAPEIFAAVRIERRVAVHLDVLANLRLQVATAHVGNNL